MSPKTLGFQPSIGPYLRGGGGASDELSFVAHSSTVSRDWAIERHARGGLYMCARDNQEAAGDLKEQLERAIKEERYEDASKIRDAIKAMGSGKGPSDGASDANNVRERLRQKEISRLRDIDTGGDNMATPF